MPTVYSLDASMPDHNDTDWQVRPMNDRFCTPVVVVVAGVVPSIRSLGCRRDRGVVVVLVECPRDRCRSCCTSGIVVVDGVVPSLV